MVIMTIMAPKTIPTMAASPIGKSLLCMLKMLLLLLLAAALEVAGVGPLTGVALALLLDTGMTVGSELEDGFEVADAACDEERATVTIAGAVTVTTGGAVTATLITLC